MKRLSKPAAAILREEIQAGRMIYNLDTHMMLHGTCETFEPLPAKLPTKAKPGSNEKIEVMRSRIASGQSLVHPGDNSQPINPSGTKLIKYVSGLREVHVELSIVQQLDERG